MAKSIAELTNRISIFFLKKYSYLPQEKRWQYGNIVWTRGSWENNMNFYVQTSGMGRETIETSYIELIYTVITRQSGEKTDMRYKIPLVTTPCRYGGKRYWFICELSKNGVYCGKRVGVLYNIGNWFGCRYCGEIAYAAQMEGGKLRWSGVSIPDIEKAEKEVKRYYYNGEPTRQYRRLIRLNEKFEIGWVMMAARLDKRFGRFAPSKK